MDCLHTSGNTFNERCLKVIRKCYYSYIEKMFVGISLLQGIEDFNDSIAGILLANQVC